MKNEFDRIGKPLNHKWRKDRSLIPLGTKVYYDVFPEGINFPAVVSMSNVITGKREKVLKAVGKAATNFRRSGMSEVCGLFDADDIRLRRRDFK